MNDRIITGMAKLRVAHTMIDENGITAYPSGTDVEIVGCRQRTPRHHDLLEVRFPDGKERTLLRMELDLV